MKTLALATGAALVALTGAANAADLVALTGDATLTMIDGETWEATGSTEVSGIEGRLLGIDVRPVDGMLYGLLESGSVVTIDPASGEATEAGMLDISLPGDAAVTVDFNPAADALRIMASDGTNLRANMTEWTVTEDGSHAYAEADMHAGETANIVAGAYTNSYAGTEETALYTIDATIAGLIQQVPPNDGTLEAIGKLGIEGVDTVGFDILSDGEGGNSAWLVAGGMLYEVDLESGAATEVGAISGIDGEVRDIAILPAM